MKPFTSIKLQRGDFLVEAVIGLILVSIVGQGMLYLVARTSATQASMRLQEVVVNQMRSALMQNLSGTIDICSTAPVIVIPTADDVTAEVQGCDATTSVTINDTVVFGVPKPIILSVTSDVLGGQIVVGGTWTET